MAEPLNATFFALRRRDRAVLLPASIVYAVIVVVLAAAFVALNWGALTHFFTLLRTASTAEPSEAEALRLFSGMMGLFGWGLLFLFPFYIATAAYEAACLRWMIRGEAPGLFGITFNHDTWRVYGVYWVWLVVHMVVGFAASMLTMPLMFMMMGDVIARGGMEPDAATMLDLQVRLHAISLLQYIPMAFLGIRFGPAAATSVARRHFSFFEAWNVTRDRFWALFGSFAVLWIGFGLAHIALMAVLYWSLLGPLIADAITAWPNLPADLMERYTAILFAPSSWVVIAIGYATAFVLTLAYAVLSYGVNARAALAALEEGKISAPEQAHG